MQCSALAAAFILSPLLTHSGLSVLCFASFCRVCVWFALCLVIHVVCALIRVDSICVVSLWSIFLHTQFDSNVIHSCTDHLSYVPYVDICTFFVVKCRVHVIYICTESTALYMHFACRHTKRLSDVCTMCVDMHRVWRISNSRETICSCCRDFSVSIYFRAKWDNTDIPRTYLCYKYHNVHIWWWVQTAAVWVLLSNQDLWRLSVTDWFPSLGIQLRHKVWI